MVNHHQLSERHACALVGLSRNACRYLSQASALNVQLRDQIIQTAHTLRRWRWRWGWGWGWGHRMIHDVLCPQFPGINQKRVYRIYTAEDLPCGGKNHKWTCVMGIPGNAQERLIPEGSRAGRPHLSKNDLESSHHRYRQKYSGDTS